MFCFRRLYSTLPKPPAVAPAAIEARSVSTPIQVRRRRQRRQSDHSHPTPATSSIPSVLTPSDKDRYARLKRLGVLLREDKGYKEPTEEEWIEEVNEKRSRIRGTRKRTVQDPVTGESVEIEDVVGKRIYLPNTIFRLVRNYTPPGQPYNPWEATFYIPLSLTKLDIRSYLWAVYGVKCTYVRTDIRLKPLYSRKRGVTLSQRDETRKSYKRAVVGLVEPFYFPEALEDMDLEERQARLEWLDVNFQLDLMKRRTSQAIGKPPKPIIPGQRSESSSPFVPAPTDGRKKILKAVLARRLAREQTMDEHAQSLLIRSKQDTTPVDQGSLSIPL